QLRKVGTGMGLIYYGLCVVVVAMIIGMVGGYAAASRVANVPAQGPAIGQPPAFGKQNPFRGFDPDEQAKVVQAMANAGRPMFILVGLTAQVLFVVFIQQLAKYIRRSDLADRAIWVLKWAIITVVLYVVGIIGTVVGALLVGPLALIGVCGLLGVVIFGLVVF